MLTTIHINVYIRLYTLVIFSLIAGENMISSITPIDGQTNQFLIANASKLIRVHWDGVSDEVDKLETLAELKNDKYSYAFNDARVDFSGHLWIGKK